jgi:hypothetical protein
MGWRRGEQNGPGDEPDPDSGPPRHGPHREDQFRDEEPRDDAGAGGAGRDERLAGFAAGGSAEPASPADGSSDGGSDGDSGDGPDNGRRPDSDGDDSGVGDDGDGGDPGSGGGGPDRGTPPGPSPGPRAVARPGTDLIIPLMTLLGLGNRPGEAYRLGPLDPDLCRKLAALAANSPATEFCVTVTDHHGFAIGHGCARPRAPRHAAPTAPAAFTALAARINLTIPLTDLSNPTRPASRTGYVGRDSRGSPWDLTRRGGDHGPPGGYGTWTLTIPGGREFIVRLEQVPTLACDHARESRGYQPSDPLRHLVQVRDGECTFPTCTRHARESDFEHAIPYHKGGRTCACNAGARSRKCHRIKQSKGWNVTQPKPGWHQWTTPTGHTYTQEPKRYPA